MMVLACTNADSEKGTSSSFRVRDHYEKSTSKVANVYPDENAMNAWGYLRKSVSARAGQSGVIF